MSHVVVSFQFLYGIYYVPLSLQGSIGVGDLVVCESQHGTCIGTVIGDCSATVPLLRQARAAALARMREEQQRYCARRPQCVPVDPLCPESPEGVAAPPAYVERAASGRPREDGMMRLPRVVRRGANKDRKRVYHTAMRSREAVDTVLPVLAAAPALGTVHVEYQVDFLRLHVLCSGQRSAMTRSDAELAQLGASLQAPLRTEVVEFRFGPEECDLTRAVVGGVIEPGVIQQLRAHGTSTSRRGGAGGHGDAHGHSISTPSISLSTPCSSSQVTPSDSNIFHQQPQPQPQSSILEGPGYASVNTTQTRELLNVGAPVFYYMDDRQGGPSVPLPANLPRPHDPSGGSPLQEHPVGLPAVLPTQGGVRVAYLAAAPPPQPQYAQVLYQLTPPCGQAGGDGGRLPQQPYTYVVAQPVSQGVGAPCQQQWQPMQLMQPFQSQQQQQHQHQQALQQQYSFSGECFIVPESANKPSYSGGGFTEQESGAYRNYS